MADSRLIVALDVASVTEARTAVEELGDLVSFYKIGHQLAFAPDRENGLHLARDLVAEGKSVFLDLKLLDIDNTVAKGVENIVKMGVTMLTIHAYPKAMRAAVAAAKGSDLCLLGVTVLTSMDHDDLIEAGFAFDPKELAKRRSEQALAAGMGGVVASAHEAEAVRTIIGSEMALVTPGIRPTGSVADDQKRVVTPADAIRAGATHIVVGRPVVAASDRRAAAESIVRDIAEL